MIGLDIYDLNYIFNCKLQPKIIPKITIYLAKISLNNQIHI